MALALSDLRVLKRYIRTRVKGGEVPGQGLAKEVWAILEALRKDCPCKLFCRPGLWVLPCESKRKYGGHGKEGQDREMGD